MDINVSITCETGDISSNGLKLHLLEIYATNLIHEDETVAKGLARYVIGYPMRILLQRLPPFIQTAGYDLH